MVSTTKRLATEVEAATMLRAGSSVAFPTETVFGLGADATSGAAIEKIFAAKGRPSDNPLIVHLPDASAWPSVAREMTNTANVLLQAFGRGPLTVVLPRNRAIHPLATAGLDTVGIRIPACPVASKVLREAKIPIAAPSANLSGRPSCTQWESVLHDLDGRIDSVLCKNTATIGLESTVVDCCGEHPRVLRPGSISLEQIRQFFPQATALPTQQSTDADVASPGVRHPHYQPSARVTLYKDTTELAGLLKSRDATHLAICGIETLQEPSQCVAHRAFRSVEEYAANFYEFLRQSDAGGAVEILVQVAPGTGIAIALRDRQLRAAGQTDA